MKPSITQRWRPKALRASCLLALLWALCTASAVTAQKTNPARTMKDPKLSSVLCELRDSVAAGSALRPLRESSSGAPVPETVTLSLAVQNALRSRTLRVDASGAVQVYIEMDGVTPAHLAALRGLGATIQVVAEPGARQSSAEAYALVPTAEAMAPPAALAELEALPFVRYIRLPDYGIASTGSVDSQGDVELGAQAVRSKFGLDGTGVTIGVISTGIAGVFATGCTTSCGPVSSIPSPMTLGDLPNSLGTRSAAGLLTAVNPITNPSTGITTGFTAVPFPATGGDLEDSILPAPEGAEGTALMEIVYDLTPNATVIFANGPSSLDFEMAVNYLATRADVVVDDRSFLTPPYDGTSAVSTNTSDALNNNSNQIRAYVTSVGNFALDHYEGSWADSHVDGTTITDVPAGDLHLFQAATIPVTDDFTGLGPQPFDPLVGVAPDDMVNVYLAWNDPTGASSNDYDLYLVPLSCSGKPLKGQLPNGPCSISGPPLASSKNPQSGTQDPTEMLSWPNTGALTVNVGIVIQNVGNLAQSKTFDMFIPTPYGKTSFQNHNFNTVSGSVGAQSDAGGSPASVISVAAVSASSCSSCLGTLEALSGQGPTQATPQEPTGRTKPDVTAVDGVCITGAGGFGVPDKSGICALSPSSPSYTPSLFYGTSAAASHVAAIAALLLQAAPCMLSSSNALSPSSARMELSSLLLKNADALPGYNPSTLPNNQVGYGKVDAYASMLALLPTNGILTINGNGIVVNSSNNSATLGATSSNGATVEITTAATSPPISNCQPAAMQWAGTCGSNSVQALHTTLTCPVGVNSIEVSLSYDNAKTAFFPISQATPYTVVVTDFALAATPSTPTTISPGATASYVITATSSPQGLFGIPITLACVSGLPPGTGCSFSNPTVTIAPASSTGGSIGATSTLTIFTSSVPSLRRKPASRYRNLASLAFCFGGPLVLFCVGLKKNSGRRAGQRWLIPCLTLSGLAALTSCGSSSQPAASTPTQPSVAGTYTIMVSGTSNQLQHTVPITLTLQ